MNVQLRIVLALVCGITLHDGAVHAAAAPVAWINLSALGVSNNGQLPSDEPTDDEAWRCKLSASRRDQSDEFTRPVGRDLQRISDSLVQFSNTASLEPTGIDPLHTVGRLRI
jgi:hypothetical protein